MKAQNSAFPTRATIMPASRTCLQCSAVQCSSVQCGEDCGPLTADTSRRFAHVEGGTSCLCRALSVPLGLSGPRTRSYSQARNRNCCATVSLAEPRRRLLSFLFLLSPAGLTLVRFQSGSQSFSQSVTHTVWPAESILSVSQIRILCRGCTREPAMPGGESCRWSRCFSSAPQEEKTPSQTPAHKIRARIKKG